MAILGKIPKQNFEVIRDLIGCILKEEIQNQIDIRNDEELDSFTDVVDVYSERIEPIGQSDEVVINVQLASANYTEQNRVDIKGNTTFFIDIYTTGKESANTPGSLVSSNRLHNAIGWVRFILSHSEYRRLTTVPGIVGGSIVESFNILEPSLKEDSLFFRMARITYSIRLQERQDINIGKLLETNFTNIKLNLTEKGYKYEFNN